MELFVDSNGIPSSLHPLQRGGSLWSDVELIRQEVEAVFDHLQSGSLNPRTVTDALLEIAYRATEGLHWIERQSPTVQACDVETVPAAPEPITSDPKAYGWSMELPPPMVEPRPQSEARADDSEPTPTDPPSETSTVWGVIGLVEGTQAQPEVGASAVQTTAETVEEPPKTRSEAEATADGAHVTVIDPYADDEDPPPPVTIRWCSSTAEVVVWCEEVGMFYEREGRHVNVYMYCKPSDAWKSALYEMGFRFHRGRSKFRGLRRGESKTWCYRHKCYGNGRTEKVRKGREEYGLPVAA